MLRVWARKIFCIMDLLRSLFDKDRSNLAIAIKTWRPNRLQTDQAFKANRTQIDKFCLAPPDTLQQQVDDNHHHGCGSHNAWHNRKSTTPTQKKNRWNQESTSNHPVGVCQNSSKRSISKSVTCNSKTMSFDVIYKYCIVCPTSYERKHAIKTLEQSKLGQQLFESSGLWICPNPVANHCRCWAVRDLLPILPAEMLMHMASLARNLYL